jgi:hypothetical protein
MRYPAMSAGLLLVSGVALANAPPAHAQDRTSSSPSFACRPQQSVVASTVCRSRSLAAADREMAALYAANRVSAFGEGESNQLDGQRRTLRAMEDCATPSGKATIDECLRATYDARNYALAIGAVMRAPELALPVARRLDPAFAPVLEAIVLWASEPEDTDWSAPSHAGRRSRILTLLRPVLSNLLNGENSAFGRDMLDDATGAGVVTKVEDLLVSPDRLVGFLDVLGPLLPDGGGVGVRQIPCAAIVGHPKLLGATASIYGDQGDNRVFNTDCEAGLPPLPAFSALVKKLSAAWPGCEGTIRYAAYRKYEVSIDTARLGRTPHDAKLELPARDGVSTKDVAAARAELVVYYTRYLRKARPQAVQMAVDALGAVLTTAGQCE